MYQPSLRDYLITLLSSTVEAALSWHILADIIFIIAVCLYNFFPKMQKLTHECLKWWKNSGLPAKIPTLLIAVFLFHLFFVTPYTIYYNQRAELAATKELTMLVAVRNTQAIPITLIPFMQCEVGERGFGMERSHPSVTVALMPVKKSTFTIKPKAEARFEFTLSDDYKQDYQRNALSVTVRLLATNGMDFHANKQFPFNKSTVHTLQPVIDF